MDCSSPGSSGPWGSPSKNTGVGCHALLQGIFQTQGLNPGPPHCRWILYHLSPQGSHGFLGGTHGKESACQFRRCRWCGFNPRVRKNPENRKWQHISVFLPGKSHGQRSLMDYSLWGCKQTWLHACTHTHRHIYLYTNIKYTFSTHLKTCWIALVIIKILIKTSVRYHYTFSKRLKYKWLRIPRFGEEVQ